STGIGRESAIALSKAGWNIVLTARRAEALEETASLCVSAEKCLVLAGDVTDEAFVKNLFSQPIYIPLNLIQNAGVGSPAVPLEEVSLETLQRVMSVNLVGPFLCSREAMKAFKNQSPPGGESTRVEVS
ncbi:hypothetical protein C8R47DRAFT_997127, partial [Mycena vitilis]